jgi:hypothetical protein
MSEPDHYVGWSLADRLQMLALEAELARLPRSLITALWEVTRTPTQAQPPHETKREILDALSHLLIRSSSEVRP